MKKSFRILTTFLLITGFTWLPPGNTNDLVGRWTIYAPDGSDSHEYVEFKKDGTYDVVLPDGTIGENGNYKLDQSTFSIKNIKGVCGAGYWGKYQLTFHGEDSLSFVVIEDTCTDRRNDIVGGNPGLKRIKNQ
jgi:hypothetical protein